MVINALGSHTVGAIHESPVQARRQIAASSYDVVGAPVLGRPNLAHFDGICVITIISPLGSACIGRLGRGVCADSNEHLPTTATPVPLLRGN